MSLENEKKRRAGLRRGFTKVVTELENLLNAGECDLNNVKALQEVLDSRFREICQKDAVIYDLLNEQDDVDETAVDDEVSKVDEYSIRYSKVKNRVAKLMEDDSHTEDGSLSSHIEIANVSYKLPKIKLKEFNGELNDWLPFWDQFKKIHLDERLGGSEKMHYLLMSIPQGSKAREVVESFPATAEMYPEVVKALKQRFGRDDLLTEFYIREMLGIILQNTTAVKKLPLSMLYDKMQSHLRNLETLGVTTDNCAPILLPLVSSCLPPDVLKTWERKGSSGSSSKDVLQSLMEFVKCEVEGEQKIAMAMAGFGLKSGSSAINEKRSTSEKSHSVPTASGLLTASKANTRVCIFCSGSHMSQDCEKAYTMSLTDRRRLVDTNRACFCCLRVGHSAKFCRNRPKCEKCTKSHHPIVCDSNKFKKDDVHDNESEALANVVTPCRVLMQTLLVKIKGKCCERRVRALIDTASQRSYILNSTALSMDYVASGSESIRHALFGGLNTDVTNHQIFTVRLASLDGSYHCHFEALGHSRICNDIPPVAKGPWLDELASEDVMISDVGPVGPIEILIGADLAGKLLTGQHIAMKCGLVAVQTKLGWTLMGKIPRDSHIGNDKGVAATVINMLTKEAKIQDLWALDTLGIVDPSERLSKVQLELATYRHFCRTVTVTKDGRFEIHLPWIEKHPPLPSNYDIALKRLESTVRKLKREGHYDSYQKLLDEWNDEGVIEEMTPESQSRNCHYLPHRHVIKHGSTTPVRPVFDASAHENRHPSLNQCLEKGPNYIEKIPSVLARFRLKKVGIVGDIRRAFLQISVAPVDRDFLRFLWLDGNQTLKTFRHCRVVFGLTSSPFELAACLDLHLEQILTECRDGRRSFPADLIEKLKASFYVDNCVTSLEDERETEEFIKVSTAVMSERMFDLRGWESITAHDVPPTNVLGLLWDRKLDSLSVNVSNLTSMDVEKVTKRAILSLAHRLFDPLGLTCCVSLIPKQLLQKTWERGIGWDQEVDDDVRRQFQLWFRDIHYLEGIKIPRWLPGCNARNPGWTLHIFSDASQKSYGTVAFLRVEHELGVRVRLINAKSKVSPISKLSNKMTIPRLELLAATIASRLYKNIVEDYEFGDIKTIFWTDATTIIAWINREEPWDVFVYNRVKEIRQLTLGHQWRHIPGSMNPADLPSRGCTAKKLLESRWWEGPNWLKCSEDTWPQGNVDFDEDEINSERKREVVSSMVCGGLQNNWYYHRFSQYKMIVRMIAWIYRYRNNIKLKENERIHQDLTATEFLAAEMKVFWLIQNEAFDGVFDPKLASLLPFVDATGLIRIITKVSYRDDVNDYCYPIVLPDHRHPVVFRLILDVHKDSCHAGLQAMMSRLRDRFWVLGGRRTIKAVLSSCITCKRYSARRVESAPIPLPDTRVRNARVFEICGVDLAGPLFLKNEDSTQSKAYVCLFTCGVYRAVHLELISSQSTDSFLQGLRRFTSRRGRPSIIYSDRGTNFAGFDNDCGGLDWTSISQYSSVRRIEWRFNPPASPWWGGWWERLIGILKNLLRRILGQASINYEEMQTVLCDCEAIINSRPLTYITQDPSDLAAITPAMFLMEVEEVGVPDFDLIEANHVRKRLRYRQHLKEILRKRFRSEYLGQLKLATNGSPREVTAGEIVLIGSDDRKRLNWPLARIVETVKGKDGHTRLVKVKTATGELLRPVQRIYPLELELKLDEDTESVRSLLRRNISQPQSTEEDQMEEEEGTVQEQKDEEKPKISKRGRKIIKRKVLDL